MPIIIITDTPVVPAAPPVAPPLARQPPGGTGRDVQLARMYFVTVVDALTEVLGDELDTSGGTPVAGARRARPFTMVLPLRGDSAEADPYAYGERLRRQVRSYFENTQAKLGGSVFVFAADPDVACWLLVGAAQVVEGPGTLTLADWKLEMQDSYRVGTPQQHRPARRLDIHDRRLATTARDYRGTVYGTDFSDVPALPVNYLPPGVADVVGVAGQVVPVGLRATLGGAVAVVPNRQHLDVLAYELPLAAVHTLADVVVYDRRGKGDFIAYGGSVQGLASLRGYWRLGEPVGSTYAYDTGPHQNNGVYIGTPAGVPGLVAGDNAVELVGDGGVYVQVPDSSSLDVVGDMSVGGWLQLHAGDVNLLDNPSFEAEVWPWQQATAGGSPTVTDFARSMLWAGTGLYALHVAATGDAGAATEVRTQTVTGLDGIPVHASTQYTYQCVANIVTAPDGGGLRLAAVWYDEDGNFLSAAAGPATGATTGVTVLNHTFASPVNAAFVVVRVDALLAASGAADYYLDSAQLTEGVVAPPWPQLRPRWYTLLSKWRSVDGYRSFRFAYDAYDSRLVFDISDDGLTGLRATAPCTVAPEAVVQAYVVYAAAQGRASFYANSAAYGTVVGLPVACYAGAAQATIGKWEADA